ncbi:MAG: type II toxin-antitoxin system HicB family antitoxin [Phascolarctobacterium sp.]|nr:type II toxin-antitoxin system HicB family antitoxin [Phascolarctobacterium sp.]
MKVTYPACFYKESDGSYTVIFPDLNHLATCGDSLEDAMAMANDCLVGYLCECKQSNDIINTPSKLQDINPNDEYNDYEEVFVNILTVDI